MVAMEFVPRPSFAVCFALLLTRKLCSTSASTFYTNLVRKSVTYEVHQKVYPMTHVHIVYMFLSVYFFSVMAV